jgi:hypothetical protein
MLETHLVSSTFEINGHTKELTGMGRKPRARMGIFSGKSKKIIFTTLIVRKI